MKRIKRGCAIICCLIAVLCACAGSSRVLAETKGDLSGTVTVAKKDKDCVLQVQVSNTGADFDGTVRLVFSGTENEHGCAFDQRIALPQGGQKEYTLTIPSVDINQTKGNGVLAFLDQKGTVVASEAFPSIFGKERRGIQVGVLSDHFDQLSWMAMSGQTYYLHGRDQNLYLTQLDADTLKDTIGQMYFLVIDAYDVDSLGKENIRAVKQWVSNGGWLLIGTGARVSDTLDGFGSQFTQIRYGNGTKPGTQESQQLRQRYSGFENLDFADMTVAQLQSDSSSAYDSDIYPGWVDSYGDGAIGVCAISFSEPEMQKATSDLCYSIYDQVASYSKSISQYQEEDEWGWSGRNAFGVIDHANTSLDFSWLKVLMVIYVVAVGPVVYLLLSRLKKRDWYWIAVPVLGLCFIGVVFFFGRGLKLHETRAYAVTAQPADGNDTAKISTYYNAYHSGVKPWQVLLSDNYTYAGTGINEYYGTGSSRADASKYHYRVIYDNGVSIGTKPQSNFENTYLFAAGTAKGCGTIDTEDLIVSQVRQEGTVQNNTGYDFPYLLLVSDDYLLVMEDVKAGERVAINAKNKKILYSQAISYDDDIYTALVQDHYSSSSLYERKDLAAALYLGWCQIRGGNNVAGSVIVAGVTDAYPKTIKSKCSQLSFGCLYTIAGQEVSHASN